MNIETANRLIELRKRKGMSQEELAEAIGVSRQAISKWERAESGPDVDNAILLSRLYGVSLDELFGNKPLYEVELDSMAPDPAPASGETETPAEPMRLEAPAPEYPGFAKALGDNRFEGVRKLECSLRANVDIIGNDGDLCTVSLEGPRSDREAVNIRTEGDKLVISSDTKNRLFGFGGTRLRLSVVVPNAMQSVYAKLSGGDLRIENLSSESVSAVTGGGDISIRSSRTSTLGLTTGGGDIEIEGVAADKAEATSGGGDIQAKAVDAKGLFSARTGGGDISLSGSAKCVDAVSGGGDISLKLSAEGIKTKTGGGDVDIEAEAVKFIGAKTGGGDITVTMAGCTGLSADVASMGGEAEISYMGETIASGRKLEVTAGDASARLEMRAGGGDITVKAY